MSNCVTIHTSIAIPECNFNFDQFKNDSDSTNCLKQPPEDFEEWVMWWYLGDNVFKDDGFIIINLGHHRSTHTLRDLNQTLHVLHNYIPDQINGTVHCPVIMSDESDGFNTEYNATLSIKRLEGI